MQQNPRAFVAYVRNNARTVRRLVADLKIAGIDVWWDEDGLKAGDDWEREIQAIINSGAFFVACFSVQYWRRNAPDGEGTYMNKELLIAIERLRRQPQERNWFIPVCLSPCQIPDDAIAPGKTLRDIQHVKLWRNWEQGIRRIVEVVVPEGPLPSGVRAELLRLDDPDPMTRCSATEALGRLREPRAVEQLIRALEDENARVRIAASSALGGIRDLRAVEPLLGALEDGNVEVREAVATTLGQIRDLRALEALIRGLLDTEPRVRRAAALALGEIESPLAVQALTEALEDDYPVVRRVSAEALGRIRDAHAVASLVKSLDDTYSDVRSAAALALGRIADSRATSPLIALLGDKVPDVQRQAAKALREIGDPDGVRAVDGSRWQGLLS